MTRQPGVGSEPERAERIDVLHVDDEPDLLAIAARFLERFDERLSVATETDPVVAIDRLRDEEYDAVVSDYDMPDLTGIELLERVREEHPRLPFVLFTGKGSEEVASEAISKGVTDYLQKGTGTDRYEVLANRVTNAVAGARAEAEVEQVRRAMDAAWDGISLLDDEGRFTYLNEAYADVFGRDRDAMLSEQWTICYPDGADDVVYDEILPAARDAGVWTGETTLCRADGSEFVGAHTVAMTVDGGAVCVVRDLSERMELDRELGHERDRFQLLVESVEEYAIFMLDADGRVASWNPGAERITGYDAAAVVGEHASQFLPGDGDPPGVDGLIDEAARTGVATHEGPRHREDGSRFWANVTVTALDGDSGSTPARVRGFGVVVRDVTERKERERREQRNEAYRKRLYQVASDPSLDLRERVVALLDLGVDRLGIQDGHLVAIDPATDRYEIVAVSDTGGPLSPGDLFSLADAYCRRTITSDEVLGIYDAAAEGLTDDPGHTEFGLSCYLGAKLVVDGELFGTVCFSSTDPRDEPFRHDDKAFVDLLGRWLSYELSYPERRQRLLEGR